MPKKNIPWTTLVFCNHCKDLLYSRYSGQFVQCRCGKCSVDQTPHYVRVGGNDGEFQQFNIQIDWKRDEADPIRDNWPYGITAEQLRVVRSKLSGKGPEEPNRHLSHEEEAAEKLQRGRAKKALPKRKNKRNEVRK